jgi:pimeloyl-ACP methyl ester carboxylesterase
MRLRDWRRGVAIAVVVIGIAAGRGFVSDAAGLDDDPPVVFVPGILGSQLEDDRGVVWGTLPESVSRFSDLEFPRDPRRNKLRATRIVEKVGLGPFKVGQYSGLIETLRTLGFRPGETLFIFPYDWRQSNLETARQLKTFIEGQPQLKNRDCVIVAHSMGGIVARLYIQGLGGSTRVKRLITLGTPHRGSAEALQTFFEGMGSFKNFVAGGESVVRRVMFSFPSMYELLPAYDGCCVLGAPSDPGRRLISVLDTQYWRRFGWPPPEYRDAEGLDFVGRSIDRATEIHKVLNGRWPSETRLHKIAGDLVDTTTRVYFDAASGKPVRWDVFGGDGTVPSISGTDNEPVESEVALYTHATIFNDDHVKVSLKRKLVRARDLEKFSSTPPTAQVRAGADRRFVAVKALRIASSPSYHEVGAPSWVTVRITDPSGKGVPDVQVTGSVEGPDAPPGTVSVEGDGVYRYSFVGPASPRAYMVTLNVPGIGPVEEYFVALAAVKKED